MNYNVEIINPHTDERRQVLVELSTEQTKTATEAPCLQTYVQSFVWPNLPDGFIPLGNGVRPVTLQ